MQKRESWKKWEKKGDLHLINRIQWDRNELESIEKVFNRDWFGYGDANEEFEKKFSDYTGIPFFNLTNSGSTAITTAIKVLIHQGKLKSGDLILHPITTFPTSISPAIDFGLIPVFIETKPNTYVADEEQVEKAIKQYPEIKGMILPHLLGNVPHMNRIKAALGSRFLIEDCCDTLGGYFDENSVGSFGDFAVFSFYGSHHITACGVGGALGVKNLELNEIAKSIIRWGHDFVTGQGFLHRYNCSTIGNDFQMSDIQAAFGLAQLEKLNGFIGARNKQFKEMNCLFKEYDFFNLPVSDPKSEPSWFCYPLTVKDSAPFTKEDFVDYLTENNIETRPIMCGNLLKQKAFQNIKRITLNEEKFPIGDYIQRTGLFIPCWGMPEEEKADYYRILKNFLDPQKSQKNISFH